MNLPGPLSRKQQVAIAAAAILGIAIAVMVASGILSVSLQMMGPNGETPPQGTFHVTDGKHVSITRDVGEPVDASNLEIRVNNTPRGTWEEISGGTESVAVGDSVRIADVESGDVVALYWTGNNVSQKLVRKSI